MLGTVICVFGFIALALVVNAVAKPVIGIANMLWVYGQMHHNKVCIRMGIALAYLFN